MNATMQSLREVIIEDANCIIDRPDDPQWSLALEEYPRGAETETLCMTLRFVFTGNSSTIYRFFLSGEVECRNQILDEEFFITGRPANYQFEPAQRDEEYIEREWSDALTEFEKQVREFVEPLLRSAGLRLDG